MKTFRSPDNQQNERGFMTVALLIILELMLIYTAANIQTLSALNRDIKAVEEKQIQRLNRSQTVSNSGTSEQTHPAHIITPPKNSKAGVCSSQKVSVRSSSKVNTDTA